MFVHALLWCDCLVAIHWHSKMTFQRVRIVTLVMVSPHHSSATGVAIIPIGLHVLPSYVIAFRCTRIMTKLELGCGTSYAKWTNIPRRRCSSWSCSITESDVDRQSDMLMWGNAALQNVIGVFSSKARYLTPMTLWFLQNLCLFLFGLSVLPFVSALPLQNYNDDRIDSNCLIGSSTFVIALSSWVG